MDEIERQLQDAVARRDEVARKLGSAEQNMMRLRRGERFQPINRPDGRGQLTEPAEIEELLRGQIETLRGAYQKGNQEVMYLQGVLRMPPAVREQVIQQRRQQAANQSAADVAAGRPVAPTEEQRAVVDEQERRRQEMLAEQERNRKRAQGVK